MIPPPKCRYLFVGDHMFVACGPSGSWMVWYCDMLQCEHMHLHCPDCLYLQMTTIVIVFVQN